MDPPPGSTGKPAPPASALKPADSGGLPGGTPRDSVELTPRTRKVTMSLPQDVASAKRSKSMAQDELAQQLRDSLRSPCAEVDSTPLESCSDDGEPEDWSDFDLPARLQPPNLPARRSSDHSLGSSAPTAPPSEQEEAKQRRKRRDKLVRRVSMYSVSTCLLGIAIVMRFAQQAAAVLYFEWWRWLFFLGCLAPVWDLCTVGMRLVLLLLQSSFFAYKGLLFFVIAVQGWLACTARIGLSLAIFAGLFSAHLELSGPDYFFWTMLRIGACLLLASVAQVAKIVVAKALSTQFYKTTYFDKMQDALRKEYFLVALSQRRPREGRQSLVGHSFSFVQRQHSKFAGAAGSLATKLRTASSSLFAKPGPGQERRGPGQDLRRRERAQSSASETAELLGSLRRAAKEAAAEIPGGEGREGEEEDDIEKALGSRSQSPLKPRPSQDREGEQGERGERGGDPVDEEEAELEGLRLRTRSSDIPPVPALPTGRPTTLLRSRPIKRMIIPQDIELPQRADSEHREDPNFHLRLHRAETHLRKQTLRTSIVERIGEAHGLDADSHDGHARKLAFHLFLNLKGTSKRQHVTLEDLKFFLPDDRAAEAFEYFDVDGNAKITIEDLREAIARIYGARRNLAASLADTKSVMGNLERLLGITIHLAFILLYLAIFQVALTQLWLTVSSMLLSFVFVFGNSIRVVYESVIFLFVMRPYDVGDLVIVNGDTCTVAEIALLTTIFNKWDGSRILIPNIKLAGDAVTNLTRSGNKGETLKVVVDINCLGREPTLIDEIDAAVVAHVKDNPGDFTGDSSTNGAMGPEPYKLTITVWWTYRFNASHGRLGPARTSLMTAVNRVLERHHSSRQPLFTQPPFAFAPLEGHRPPSRSASSSLRR